MANYQKIDRKLKKYWVKSIHFCLGPKTGNGHWNPCFALRSKIHVFGSTFSLIALTGIVPEKFYTMIWPLLEIGSLNLTYLCEFNLDFDLIVNRNHGDGNGWRWASIFQRTPTSSNEKNSWHATTETEKWTKSKCNKSKVIIQAEKFLF